MQRPSLPYSTEKEWALLRLACKCVSSLVSRLRSRFVAVDLQGKTLPGGVDCRDGFGTIRRGGSAVGVLGVWLSLIDQVGGQGGNGLFPLKQLDLNRWPAAVPFDLVIAGRERLAIDNDVVVTQFKRSFVSFPREYGRRKQKRSTEKNN